MAESAWVSLKGRGRALGRGGKSMGNSTKGALEDVVGPKKPWDQWERVVGPCLRKEKWMGLGGHGYLSVSNSNWE